jgi:predicted secreted protein
MKWTSAVAIYFIIWWVTLFVILPLRIKNAADAGATVEEGHDAGAPLVHGLAWKAVVTTIVASVVFAVLYWLLANDILQTLDLPFVRDMPRI